MKIERRVSDMLMETQCVKNASSEVDWFTSSFMSRQREIGHVEEIKKNLPELAKRFCKAKQDFVDAKLVLDHIEYLIAQAHDVMEVYEIDNFKANKYAPDELHSIVYSIQNFLNPKETEEEGDI